MAPLPCHLQALLPDPSELGLKQIERIGNLIFIVVATTRLSVSCHVCKTPSSRIHSRYQRVLRDLPWHGAIVRMRLLCWRFYCRSPQCSCRIFTERIPKVVRRYGRFTERSRQVLSLIGYALGGEAGARLVEHIGLETSADTVLRTLKSSAPEESHPPVRVIGVDDWAWRKGQHYGTILVDPERHKLGAPPSGTTYYLRGGPPVPGVCRPGSRIPQTRRGEDRSTCSGTPPERTV